MNKFELIEKKRESFLQDQIERALTLIDARSFSIGHEETKIFSRLLTNLKQEYYKLNFNNAVGPLDCLRISFLRSGLIDHSPLYRFDLCDNTWLVNLVECHFEWSPNFVYNTLDEIGHALAPNFSRQSVVQEYELDELLVNMLERMQQNIILSLQELVLKMVSSIFNEEQRHLKIYIGDFLDQSVLIFGEKVRPIDTVLAAIEREHDDNKD